MKMTSHPFTRRSPVIEKEIFSLKKEKVSGPKKTKKKQGQLKKEYVQ